MLKLYATYGNLLRCRLSPYSDGRLCNATCHELDLCGMLNPSTYDDAVSANKSAYGDGIRRTSVSIGVITQCAACILHIGQIPCR